jgi:type I restriction enzyme, S subunit
MTPTVASDFRFAPLLEKLTTTQTSRLARAARLLQNISNQAFEGKLDAQDPREEPASALMERIKSARDGTIHGDSRARRNRRASKSLNS